MDVYCVLDAFSVTCPARAHAIKKLLCAGSRGKAGTMQDLFEAMDAINRAITMQWHREAEEGRVDSDSPVVSIEQPLKTAIGAGEEVITIRATEEEYENF